MSNTGCRGKPEGVRDGLRERVCVCDADWLRLCVTDRVPVPVRVFVAVKERVPVCVGEELGDGVKEVVMEPVCVKVGVPLPLGD